MTNWHPTPVTIIKRDEKKERAANATTHAQIYMHAHSVHIHVCVWKNTIWDNWKVTNRNDNRLKMRSLCKYRQMSEMLEYYFRTLLSQGEWMFLRGCHQMAAGYCAIKCRNFTHDHAKAILFVSRKRTGHGILRHRIKNNGRFANNGDWK